jgi:capsular exopolysaccharide synthesis family protein
MEIEKYFLPLRRWWWLLLAATVVAAVSSFLVTLGQPPIYQSRTTLLIGTTSTDPNPTTNEFILNSQLATYYADIANREPIRNATMEVLGLRRLPEYLASAVPNSQFVEIVVNDTEPARAQAVANELAHQLTLLSPTSEENVDQDRQEFVSQQLNTLQVQIEETQKAIEDLQGELGNLVSASQIADTNAQINALNTKLTTMQTIYTGLLSSTDTGASNSLTIIEAAYLPIRPIGPNKALSVMLAAAIGFALAAGAAYLLDYLDDTLKTPADVSRVLGYPIIGHLMEIEGLDDKKEGFYVADNPRSPAAEAFRAFRTNLEFTSVDGPLKTILITSPSSAEGKTSVAINLASIIAQADHKVVLLEGDLRKPKVHEYLGLSERYGLGDIFRGRIDLDSAALKTNSENVSVITSGSIPPNPTELIGSKMMKSILSKLAEKADYVIIDGPPFIVADALILASQVDGVIIIVRPGFTREGEARAMVDQLSRSGARVLGVALNRIPQKSFENYSGYRYFSTYYTDTPWKSDTDAKGTKAPKPGIQSWIGRIIKVNRQ